MDPTSELRTAYTKLELEYARTVARILRDNETNIERSDTKKMKYEIPGIRAILPYIQPDPRTNYLTTTKTNLFTKDDPILRFMPYIRTNKPTNISWYDGTVIGEQPLSMKDVANRAFIEECGGSDDAYRFLKLHKPKIDESNMKRLFCNTCLLFNCGIHHIQTGAILNPDEDEGCICFADSKEGQKETKGVSELFEEYSGSRVFRHLLCLSLKPCVTKRLIELLVPFTINCNEIKAKKLPIKTYEKMYKEIVFMEFFTPCKHAGSCTKKNCSCARNDILCEMSCFCTCCKNMKYCNCVGGCREDCICTVNQRFCDPAICSCCSGTEACGNSYTTEHKQSVVHSSAIHGFGLFCEEDVIKKNEFVMEHTGEIVSDKEAERRGNFYEMNNLSYLFNMANRGTDVMWSIDAFILGNKSRYINHSSDDANLRTTVKTLRGVTKIVFYAKRDIYKGEEFFFDYHFTEEAQRKHGMVD
ncbi:EZ [Enterospora canceri]|uniref:EZ n=1 Tax=Enterospora canceri TaxID=1081671 RepID=A0A1Y1S8F3_9MICR|nr:EZ [Enterospora canceri]